MDDAVVPPTPLYETVLRPHRSLPPWGFLLLMLMMAGASFVTGVAFVMMGAWPVTGFFGLDLLLLYGAFSLSYRAARVTETIRLVGDDVTVERVGVRGDVRGWRFQAFWLRIKLIEIDGRANRLVLTSHGRELTVGGFLSPDERRQLATELDDALVRYRTHPV